VDAASLCFFDCIRDCLRRHIRLRRNAAEPGPEGAEVDRSAVAVSRRSSSEEGEVAVAAGVDEPLSLQLVFPGMVGEAKPCDGVFLPIRPKNKGVQQNVHASRSADFVQSSLDGFRIKYHEDAAVAHGWRHCCPAPELGHDFVGDAGYGLTRLLTECAESAIGQHIAHRRGAAQATGGLEQPDARAGFGRADRSRDACGSSQPNPGSETTAP